MPDAVAKVLPKPLERMTKFQLGKPEGRLPPFAETIPTIGRKIVIKYIEYRLKSYT